MNVYLLIVIGMAVTVFGDDSGAQCVLQAQNFAQCVQHNAENDADQLQRHIELAVSCMKQAGCNVPDLPKGSQNNGVAVPASGTPSLPDALKGMPDEFKSCFNSSLKNLGTCVSTQLSDQKEMLEFLKQQVTQLAGQFGAGDHMGGGKMLIGLNTSNMFEDIHSKASNACGKDQAKFGKLLKCLMPSFETIIVVALKVAVPTKAICDLGANCIKTASVSTDCLGRFEKIKSGICTCINQTKTQAAQLPECAGLRDKAQSAIVAAMAAQQQAGPGSVEGSKPSMFGGNPGSMPPGPGAGLAGHVDEIIEKVCQPMAAQKSMCDEATKAQEAVKAKLTDAFNRIKTAAASQKS